MYAFSTRKRLDKFHIPKRFSNEKSGTILHEFVLSESLNIDAELFSNFNSIARSKIVEIYSFLFKFLALVGLDLKQHSKLSDERIKYLNSLRCFFSSSQTACLRLSSDIDITQILNHQAVIVRSPFTNEKPRNISIAFKFSESSSCAIKRVHKIKSIFAC